MTLAVSTLKTQLLKILNEIQQSVIINNIFVLDHCRAQAVGFFLFLASGLILDIKSVNAFFQQNLLLAYK